MLQDQYKILMKPQYSAHANGSIFGSNAVGSNLEQDLVNRVVLVCQDLAATKFRICANNLRLDVQNLAVFSVKQGCVRQSATESELYSTEKVLSKASNAAPC